jgi:hypothetical protein
VAMLCSAGFDNAGFDRCAISFVHQQTWQVFQNPCMVRRLVASKK